VQSTKRSRDDVSETASIRDNISKTMPKLETKERVSKRIKRKDK
jgi:hypothetical protein